MRRHTLRIMGAAVATALISLGPPASPAQGACLGIRAWSMQDGTQHERANVHVCDLPGTSATLGDELSRPEVPPGLPDGAGFAVTVPLP